MLLGSSIGLVEEGPTVLIFSCLCPGGIGTAIARWPGSLHVAPEMVWRMKLVVH